MDRLDALRALLVTIDEGSLAAAGRRLGRSPAAMTRALAGLEAQAGAKLFERSTRRLRLTEAGARYAAAVRRVLAEADALDGFEDAGSGPRGLLTLTAPQMAGADILRPVVDQFLDSCPAVQARLILLDRLVGLVEEGFDAALRIAHLPDSSLIATRVGSVRRIICAAPAYLNAHAPVSEPADLASHAVIALAETRQETGWSFASGRVQRVSPRLSVNSIAAARGSAIEGRGLVRLLSYQISADIRAGRLEVVLEAFEPPPLPVHLVAPKDRLALAKTRAFADFATPRLKAAFAAAELAGSPPGLWSASRKSRV
jgi:DNA-binding transcriptional LysR family regulator